MSENTVRHLIKETYDRLTKKEQIVAKYVLDNYQQAMLLSSSELAQAAHVSDTSVVRFAKSLGFNGFLEYKKTIIKEYVPTQKVYTSLSYLEDSREYSSSLITWYLDRLKTDISAYMGKLPVDAIEQMATAIIDSKTVYLVGLGSDEVIAKFLKNYLTVMGIKCVTISEEGLAMKESLFLVDDKDTVLMTVSPTMQDSEVWIANYARLKGAKLLLITDSEITTKKLHPDVSAEFKESAEVFFNSYIMHMMFCNALLLRIYEKYTDKTTLAMKEYQDMLSI